MDGTQTPVLANQLAHWGKTRICLSFSLAAGMIESQILLHLFHLDHIDVYFWTARRNNATSCFGVTQFLIPISIFYNICKSTRQPLPDIDSVLTNRYTYSYLSVVPGHPMELELPLHAGHCGAPAFGFFAGTPSLSGCWFGSCGNAETKIEN